MDFSKTKDSLLKVSADKIAVHTLLKDSLGAKIVDILYYDKEKKVFFDTVNHVVLQAKYIDESNLLGTVLNSKKPYFSMNISKEKNYTPAIDNPFNIKIKSQIIIPIFKNDHILGMIRCSQLPIGFDVSDYHNFLLILPALEKVFSYEKTNVYHPELENTHKEVAKKHIKKILTSFATMSQNCSNPEIVKLISTGRENIDNIFLYLHPPKTNKSFIQEKLQLLNKNKHKVKTKKIYANILIADDVRINVKILNAMLSNDAIIDQIKHAYDGIETIDIIDKCKEAKENIHILFLDHHMPGKTGLEIAKELREASGIDNKIIIVSITNDPEAIANNKHLYDYHIPKPFSKETIQKTMESIRIDHLS